MKVNVVLSPDQLKLPVTEGEILKAPLVAVSFIASEKAIVMVVFKGIPLSLSAGKLELTVGGVVSAKAPVIKL